MQFDYLYEVQATGSVEIEDIGNVVLSAVNVLLGQEYFLIIQTEYGKTKIIEYGPIFVDMESEPNFVSCYYSCIDFSHSKLSTTIDKFLNNPKRLISQVQIIELDEARERIKDVMTFL